MSVLNLIYGEKQEENCELAGGFKVWRMTILIPTMLLIALVNTSQAKPRQEDVRHASSLMIKADSMISSIDSVSDRVAEVQIGTLENYFDVGDYEDLRVQSLALIRDAQDLRKEMIRSFKIIRGQLTTMGDFQIYQSFLTEISLSSISLNSTIEHLRFEVAERENERVTKSARFLTYLGLGMAIFGLLLTVESKISRGRKIQPVSTDATSNKDVSIADPNAGTVRLDKSGETGRSENDRGGGQLTPPSEPDGKNSRDEM